MISYAQNLEDVMLARAFVGVTQGFYIDVGGYDPDNDSVTRFFYDSGWRGINVEPVPEQYEEFVRRRPRDVNLRTALGRADGQLRFHDFSPSGLSTMDPVAAARLREHGYTCREYDVPVTTLAAVCRAHAPATIDFLKIDVEGAEGEVIAGADWRAFRPRVIVVEATRPLDGTPTHAGWEPVLLEHGYIFVWFDGLNRYYLRREDADLARYFRAPPNAFDDYQIAEIARLRQEVDRLRHSTVTRTIHDLRAWARRWVNSRRKSQ